MNADLYLERIDLLRYLDATDCRQCGYSGCAEWLSRLQNGQLSLHDCPFLGTNRAHALGTVLAIRDLLPEIEVTQHPVKGITGCQEVNNPGASSPILVSGNAAATQLVITAILATTIAPFHLLFVDCLGHTVDMAVIYRTFTPQRVRRALESSGLAERVSHRELIMPGITAPLQGAMRRETGWDIRVGPLCAGELPLFLGEYWSPPPS